MGMGSEGVVEIRGVRKAFGPTLALNDVSFTLAPGSVHALLGGNGSGKSTLIKVLTGVEHADAGELAIGGGRHDLRRFSAAQAREAGIHVVHQRPTVFGDLSVAENLFIGRGFDTAAAGRIPWGRARRRAAEVLARFEIEAAPDRRLGDLSPSTQTMVAIARALQDQEGIHRGVLLLDEPTAVLPAAEVDLLFEALRRFSAAGQTIAYVTHRLEEVFALADRATLLRDGSVVDTVEPRSLTQDDLVELMVGRPIEQVARPTAAPTRGRVLLEARGVSAGGLRPIDLTLRAGEVVGVAGLTGSGRTTLLRCLFGMHPERRGTIAVAGEARRLGSPREAMAAGVAFVPEDRLGDAAFPELSVRENVSIAVLDRYWHRGLLRRRRERRDSRGLMGEFFIKAASTEAPLESLSGGNQQKVILARWLRRKPRVLLLDEPTQGVDVSARAEIYELIRAAVEGGAVALVVSGDFDELAMISDRVAVLRKGCLADEVSDQRLESETLHRLAHAEAGA